MVTPPAIALLYPSLLMSLAANSNYTILVDDHGTPHAINAREPVFTQAEIDEMSESAMKATFNLYTRKNPLVGQRLLIDDLDSVRKSYWNPDHPVRVIMHGWRGSRQSEVCLKSRDAYLQVGDYNVILIDWRDAAGDITFWRAAGSVPSVATRVALLLDFLEIEAGLNPDEVKIIGHSLGGHVAGLSARWAVSEIAEVVALDPAALFFSSKGPGQRVDRTDASVVHVIHTNAGFLGMSQAIGTADFYPNDGRRQPGCGIDITGGCAHSRSHQYYTESVMNARGFRTGDVFMGGPSLDRKARGSYFLKTASSSPFALG